MRRPNILIICTDQQRWDALGVNGNRDIQTPNLDWLAAEGVNFDHYFVQHPQCMPSRMSFLTGLYPSTLRITHMGVPAPADMVTLPQLLRNAGYATANIGKPHFRLHASREQRTRHSSSAFERQEISDEPEVCQDAYHAWVRRMAPDQFERLSMGLPAATYTWYSTMDTGDGVWHPADDGRFDYGGPTTFPGDERYTHSGFVAEQALAFLASQSAQRPFLCMAGFYSPHAPWVAPQRYLDLYDPATFGLPTFPPELAARREAQNCSEERLRAARHGYYAMISEVDHHVGRILGELEYRGLAEDTIVLFLSDHGEWLGDHLKYGKGYPGDDAVSRVPLIVRWPAGVAEPDRTVSAIIEAVDVLPTLLECAGLQVPPHLQGQSFAAALTGGAFEGRGSALMEHAGWKNLRTERYRYLMQTDGSERLWDLERDPHEYRDLAGDSAYSSILGEQRWMLVQRLVELQRSLSRAQPYTHSDIWVSG
jgi:arylsulfatase A-like enzyme